MERSPTPGSTSWPSLRPLPEASGAISAVLGSPFLKSVQTAVAPGKVWAVGGMVRDALLGLPLREFDLTTDLDSQQLAARLGTTGSTVVTTGRRHGTLTVVQEGMKAEITTFRQAGGGQGRVLEEDLAARDFTVNAIAFDGDNERFIDPTGGIGDLAERILRCPGDPHARFREDPHRILRMYRFGPASGRQIHGPTRSAAQELVATLDQVSVERIKQELERILCADDARAALMAMLEGGVIARVMPELLPSVGFPQNEFHIEDVFQHTLSVLERAPSDPLLRWAALFHDIAKPVSFGIGEDGRRHFYRHEELAIDIVRPVLERLKFSHDETKSILGIVRHHMRPINCGATGVRRILRDLDSDYDRWRRFKEADAPPIYSEEQAKGELAAFDQLVRAELTRREKEGNRLVIGGGELMELGMKPGPEMGRLLKQLEEYVIEDPARNSRELLLAEARKLLK